MARAAEAAAARLYSAQLIGSLVGRAVDLVGVQQGPARGCAAQPRPSGMGSHRVPHILLRVFVAARIGPAHGHDDGGSGQHAQRPCGSPCMPRLQASALDGTGCRQLGQGSACTGHAPLLLDTKCRPGVRAPACSGGQGSGPACCCMTWQGLPRWQGQGLGFASARAPGGQHKASRPLHMRARLLTAGRQGDPDVVEGAGEGAADELLGAHVLGRDAAVGRRLLQGRHLPRQPVRQQAHMICD